MDLLFGAPPEAATVCNGQLQLLGPAQKSKDFSCGTTFLNPRTPRHLSPSTLNTRSNSVRYSSNICAGEIRLVWRLGGSARVLCSSLAAALFNRHEP